MNNTAALIEAIDTATDHLAAIAMKHGASPSAAAKIAADLFAKWNAEGTAAVTLNAMAAYRGRVAA